MVLFWGAAREGGGKEEERREGWGGGRLSSPSSLPRGWELPGKGAEGNGGAEEPGVSTQVGTGWGWRPGLSSRRWLLPCGAGHGSKEVQDVLQGYSIPRWAQIWGGDPTGWV